MYGRSQVGDFESFPTASKVIAHPPIPTERPRGRLDLAARGAGKGHAGFVIAANFLSGEQVCRWDRGSWGSLAWFEQQFRKLQEFRRLNRRVALSPDAATGGAEVVLVAPMPLPLHSS